MAESGIEGIEDVAGELLVLPPERFTAARNAAVKALRADGRRAAADSLKTIPRPPLSLWALNRLVREQAALVGEFLEAAGGLREAYRSGGDIRAATRPERAAEARLASAAAGLLAAEGKRMTDTVARSLGQALRAAAADAEVADALGRGLLIREPAAPSIEELLGSLPPAPARAETRPAAPAKRAQAPPRRDGAAERRALRERIAAARDDVAEVRGEARTSAGDAKRARQAWEAAQALAERAQARAEAAEGRLAELRQRLEEL